MRVDLRWLVLCAWLSPPLWAQNTLVLEGTKPYAASVYPDRVTLTPAQVHAERQRYHISWRTSADQPDAIAQWVLASDDPGLAERAVTVQGNTVPLGSDNGMAHFHQLELTDLSPDTLYAYRVAGAGTWSEWFQFRTAREASQRQPLSIVYFGDAQNSVKSLFSRVVRQSLLDWGRPDFYVHAGDLIDRMGNQDDNWAEWYQAMGWLTGSVPQLFAAGNHEYDETRVPVQRVAHWDAQLTLPANGPAQFANSVYFLDVQQVRLIVLDSTPAVHDEAAALVQAQWLESVLADNTALWTVVIYHHPLVSVSRGVPNQYIERHWRPLFEQFGVDLVLQGHDHVYGRGQLDGVGPVYVTSVAGPKMNLLAEHSVQTLDVTAEDRQLYQRLVFTADGVEVESRTVTGRLHDRFEIQQQPGGKRLLEQAPEAGQVSACVSDQQSTGRCRNGL